MQYSPAAESTPLFRPWAMGVAVLLVLVVLVLTYQNKDAFMPQGQNDAVSAGYAELLLAADPENIELRSELVEMLIERGEFSRALKHLADWQGGDEQARRFYNLVLDGRMATVRHDEQAILAARQRLAEFDLTGLSPDQQTQLADLALALGLPARAADLHLAMAQVEGPDQQAHQLAAARWYLAAEQPADAAVIYQQLAEQARTVEGRRQFALLAYNGFLAADQASVASEYAVQLLDSGSLETLGDDWWLRSVQTAQGAMRFDLATRLAEHWRRAEPDSVAALQARFDMALAAGDTATAWEVGKDLLEQSPPSAELLRQMAQLGQWRGKPEAALDYWVAYLDMAADAEARDKAWRLAFQLFDYNRGIQLLGATAASRRLSDEELDALVYAHEQRGTPAMAENWLRGYLQRASSQRLAWTRLVQNLQNRQLLQREADTWPQFAGRHQLTIAERMSWAEVLWNLYQPEQAWQVLDVAPLDELSPDYWRLRAALAWELERDDAVLSSYKALLAQGAVLLQSEQAQLVDMYRQRDPALALRMQVASWRRTGDTRFLTDALQLAEEQQDWALMETLVAEAMQQPASANLMLVLLARGLLAERAGQFAEAERLYLQGLSRQPRNSLLRARILWLFVDAADRTKLARALRQWEGEAQSVPVLWLPMGAANQLLSRNTQALQWFNRHLREQPDDTLALAAYADALEASGREAAALQLRSRLLNRLRFAETERAPFTERQIWSRLMTAGGSPQQALAGLQRWHDGSVGMLQLWYAAQLARLDSINQEAQKDAWLAWGRARGLREEGYQRIQEALRSNNREALAALLVNPQVDDAHRVAAQERLGDDNQAMAQALSSLGDEQPLSVRRQLWRQSVAFLERYPQGVRVSWGQEDFGGLKTLGPQLSIARFIGDNWYLRADGGRVRYDSSLLDSSVLGSEQSMLLRAERQLPNGDLSVTLDHSDRQDDNRSGVGIARRWSEGGNEVEVGANWQRESRETGLMRALGQESGLWLRASHAFSARDQLSWQISQREFETRSGVDIGSEQQLNLEFSQIQFFEGPTWILRSGIEYQRNSLSGEPLDSLLATNGGAVRQDDVTVDQLLPERVGRIYIGSQLRRGMPGLINRNRGQYTWLLDTSTGWDWEDQSMNFAINAGIGIEVFGDDELSFTAGYQSEPVGGDGEAGGTATISYSSRFGR